MVADVVASFTIIGPRNSNMRELPAPPLANLKICSGSSPAFMPSTIASAAATLWIATSRFATYFILLPLPKAPRLWVWREKPANIGTQLRDRLRVAARIDHEVLDRGLRAGAADRAIQHGVAGLAQHSSRPRACRRARRSRPRPRSAAVAFAPAISATTACSAFGFGRLVMTTGTSATSVFHTVGNGDAGLRHLLAPRRIGIDAGHDASRPRSDCAQRRRP